MKIASNTASCIKTCGIGFFLRIIQVGLNMIICYYRGMYICKQEGEVH